MARLFLVRHGQTDANRDGLALGRSDIPLNELGVSQARCLAEALADEPFAAVYASPLQRTRQTADEVVADRDIDVEVDKSLIEMDVGEMDGLTFSEVRERFPGFLREWSSSHGPAHRMPGGERLIDVHSRAVEFLDRVMERRPERSTCAVTHNFVILTMLAHVLGIDLASFRRLRHAVAAISVLEVASDRWRVVSVNDTRHLESSG